MQCRPLSVFSGILSLYGPRNPKEFAGRAIRFVSRHSGEISGFHGPNYSQIQDLIVPGFAHQDPEVKEAIVSLTLEISRNYREVNSRELSMF
jgi:hypothetical protein